MKYEITKEQLNAICIEIELNQKSAINWIKEWSHEAFKKQLPTDFTGWCKSLDFGNENWLGYYEKGFLKYGFSAMNAEWLENKNAPLSDREVKTTESEVFEALKNEAVKRGFKENVFVKDLGNTQNGNFHYNAKLNYLYCGSYAVFCNGIWNELILTITKQEAEKLLNKKII